MVDLSGVVIALVSGAVGGGTALLGQFAAQRASRRQHLEELQQRSVELLTSFALPITTRRAEALQELFSVLQGILEDEHLSLETYELIREQLIFVPTEITSVLLPVLSSLLQSQRAKDREGASAAKSDLRAVQEELREAIGLGTIDRYVRQLNALRPEMEALT